jgi:lysozyme family protein
MVTLDSILDETLVFEGGLVDDPDDPGGLTNYGQTLPWLTDLYGRPATAEDVRGLTRQKARENYRTFASKFKLDLVIAARPWTGWLLFDFAVNTSVWTATRQLQNLLDTPTDGVIGSATLSALSSHADINLFLGMVAARLDLYGSLASTRAKFEKGWLARVATILRSVRAEC